MSSTAEAELGGDVIVVPWEPPIVDIDDARVPRAHLQMRPTKNEELKQLKKPIHASELLDLGRQVGW